MAFPLYGDENAMERRLFGMLRGAGVDCLNSNDVGKSGEDDEAQLRYASGEGRAIVTFDRVDFQRLHAEWATTGREHAGIIIVSSARIPTSVLFTQLMTLQSTRGAAEMRNALLFISPSPVEEKT